MLINLLLKQYNYYMTENELSNKIIGLANEVHTVLGPGLLESAYKECLYYKMDKTGLYVEKIKANAYDI